MPLVTVIIPTYNRASLLPRAIRSVLAQTHRPIELLIVDDGSVDDTEAIVRGFADPCITYIRHPHNQGQCAAINTGIRASKGDYDRDYALTLERMATFDYYLYTGLDEGSMGFLDALAAGVPTSVTPQGFHLDVEGGISHPFTDLNELVGVFTTLASERQRRMDSVKGLTWAAYARQHALIWRALLAGKDAASALEQHQQVVAPGIRQTGMGTAIEDARFFAGPVVNRLKRLVTRR